MGRLRPTGDYSGCALAVGPPDARPSDFVIGFGNQIRVIELLIGFGDLVRRRRSGARPAAAAATAASRSRQSQVTSIVNDDTGV